MFLVDPFVFEWLLQPFAPPKPNMTAYYEPLGPDMVNVFARNPSDPMQHVHVSIGSCANDRALALSCVYGAIDECFDSTRELNNFVKAHDIEIVDEYDGGIY